MNAAAVLVVDMQNGFCHPRGSIASLGGELPDLSSVVAANEELLAAARAAHLPVIYTRHVFRPGLIDMPARSANLWPRDPEPLVRGSWDADIIDELAPAEGDHVIDKNRYDAFLYTDLEVLLRGLGVNRLLAVGILTNVCVETTVRSADQRGFDPYVASDCTTAYGEARDPALAAMSVVFATVGKWRELFDLVGEE
ncbi:cysteine hydrolase family protein [Nonomuraea aurantiaca]|uniref:cysteine hydrolase family protein n=1 Tax=Nonomuraea aurantiaca TaxID=2878562 RepID=UPI001CDA13C0|nr:isochorismatase family cysteine hydrolase [Nonomuraea aurantiaca]MCA2220470.1 cysteine hydrolase [Nonomuraea aurantiaca]